jgi:hypothetical protein
MEVSYPPAQNSLYFLNSPLGNRLKFFVLGSQGHGSFYGNDARIAFFSRFNLPFHVSIIDNIPVCRQ